MANVLFKALPGNSPSLFPKDIFERIPQNHPVRLVNSVVDGLNLDGLLSQYKGGGTTSYHPKMMVKVLFYSYLSNIYSCRKMEKALQENIHFMWLSGHSTPDFRTINYFRGKRLKGEIHRLFAEVVKLLQGLGQLSLEVQYIDGTKIESVSNRYSFVWKKSIEKNKAKLEAKIEEVLNTVDAEIKKDMQQVNEPEVKLDSSLLKEKLTELNAKLKAPTKSQAKQLKALQEEHLPRLEKYENQLDTLKERNSYSKTDPDATFMRMKEDHMKNGQLKPGYNAQISTENQYITHYSLHQNPTDTTTLQAHLEGFEESYQTQSKEVVTDAGYGSEENYQLLKSKAITPYVKYNYFHKEQKRSYRNNPFLVANLYYNPHGDYYVCPMGQHMEHIGRGKRLSSNGYESNVDYYQAKRCHGCPLRGMCHQAKGNRRIEVSHRLNILKQEAKALLTSEEGLKHRSKRPIEVEAVFGQLKSNNRFNRFTMRGLEKTSLEFGLMAMAHNLRKWAKNALLQNNFGLYGSLLKLIKRLEECLSKSQTQETDLQPYNLNMRLAA
jgi:transposase